MKVGNGRNRKQNPWALTTLLLAVILFIIAIAALGVTVWALFLREDDQVLTPDYAPQAEEVYAETIQDDPGGKLEAPEGGSSVSLTYSREVSIRLEEEMAELLFANPGKSNQNVVLQIIIQDTVIVQSGTLKPGNRVTKLELLDNAAKKLTAGTYEGYFNVLYYNPETGEKAIVNTEIPITVAVSL